MRNTNYDGPHKKMWLGTGKFSNSLSGESNLVKILSGASKFSNFMSGMNPRTEGLVAMTQTKPGSS